MPHIIPNPTAFFSLFTLPCPASVRRGFLKNTQREIHERTTTKPSPRRVGNDALFLYTDFAGGGYSRRVMHRKKKGARHGQKRKRRKERNTRNEHESISHAKFAKFAKAVEPILKLCVSRHLEAFMLCASRLAGCSAVRGFVLRALLIARWDDQEYAGDDLEGLPRRTECVQHTVFGKAALETEHSGNSGK